MLRLPFPEEYGGLGRSVVDLAIVAEEMSRPSSDVIMAFGGSMFCGLNVLRKGIGRAEATLAAEAALRRNPHDDFDVGTGRRLRHRRDAHVGAARRRSLCHQRPENLGDWRRREEQFHQRLCQDRSEGALPPGHVAVPGRQHLTRTGGTQARHARPPLGRHLRTHLQRRARAGRPADRRREQRLECRAGRPAGPSASLRRPAIAAARAACSRWRCTTRSERKQFDRADRHVPVDRAPARRHADRNRGRVVADAAAPPRNGRGRARTRCAKSPWRSCWRRRPT